MFNEPRRICNQSLNLIRVLLVGTLVPAAVASFPSTYFVRLALCSLMCVVFGVGWTAPLTIFGFLIAEFDTTLHFGSLERQAYDRATRLILFPSIGLLVGVALDVCSDVCFTKCAAKHTHGATA